MIQLTLCAAALSLVFVNATAAADTPLPAGVFAGEPDYRGAPEGRYALDPDHTAVIAKVSHVGYSLSVFRFDKVEGALAWNPSDPSKATLDVSVDTASISTPVKGFAEKLAGDDFLRCRAYPKARFVSTGFRRIDATRGTVDGQFTLLGKTAPVSFTVELIGAGKGFMGHPRIGIEASAAIRPQTFGLPPALGTTIDVVVDAEFAQTS